MMHSPLRPGASLLERAAEIYDFGAAMRAPAFADPAPAPRPEPEVARAPEPEVVRAPEPDPQPELPPAPQPEPEAEAAPAVRPRKRPIILTPPEEEPLELTLGFEEPEIASAETPAEPRARGEVDRKALAEAGFILPEDPVTGLAEEFRIIKRQLLLGVAGGAGIPEDKRQSILVCSARSGEGKTFCALNLALSLAAEKDLEVLLVDGDFAKPQILSLLGLENGPGLVDAIADPDADAEDFVIRTDLGGLCVLPSGRQAKDVTELLASERTRAVLAGLTRNRPRRVVVFDSPPALMASPASVLATHAGQVMMVVRADQTTEADLKEAVALLSGCPRVSLMLNGTGFAAGGPRFGSYYGYGQ